MSGRPVVGITAYEEEASWNQWQLRASILPARYMRAVEAAGAVSLLIPVQRLSAVDAAAILDRLDAVVLAGGPDVAPELYGAERHPLTGAPRHERDALEMTILDAVTQRPLPTLAICRGLQVLNVARGGTLHQHLPDVVGHHGHGPDAHGYRPHEVSLAPGTTLATLLGTERADVPTHHHQAIDQLGRGLVATAWACDGTIEGAEDTSLPFLVGVQWHPEMGDDPTLLAGLVAAAAERCAGRRR